MSKAVKILYWFIFNITYFILFYLALFSGVIWAANIVMFLVNVMFVLVFLNVVIPDVRKKFKSNASMPAWVNISISFIEAIIFAGFGWFYYATLTILMTIFYAILYKGEE